MAPMQPDPVEAPVLVVGIGASAGGLEALQTFFSTLRDSSGLAFVVISHLDPASRNLLPELLQHTTALPVQVARTGDHLAAARVYIAPAQSVVRLDGGVLEIVLAEDPAAVRNPIDAFFQSLAEQRQAGAVGIILSGNGTDGTIGLKAISDAGGLTIAQDPATARYDSMPRSASTLGMADRTLPPDRIPEELLAYARHVAALAGEGRGEALNQQITDALVAICDVLQDATEHNFKHYKTSTLVRRIGRRMQVLRLGSADEYVERLRQSREEASALFKELLIGVTAFFRDPEAFEALGRLAIPAILENRSSKDPVRVWIPGCATGEEAYTIAMLFREALDRLAVPIEVSIFATDINEHALGLARQGAFPLSIAEDVSPERLQRFFIKKGNRYHVTKELRELCLFSPHDLIRDPPFSRLDLISCRNLLIYLGQHLQKKLIPLFHYALRPNGFLFLGPSESISAHRELFRPTDVKHRLSQRLMTAVRSTALLNRIEGQRQNPKAIDGTISGEHDIHLVMQRIVLDEFAPRSVVVNEEGQILCSSGGLENYLGISAGVFQNNLVKLAHSGLRVGLRAALAEAIKTSRTVVNEGIVVRTEKGVQVLKLTVQPMPQLGEQSGLYLVVFQECGSRVSADTSQVEGGFEQADALIEQLERELRTTREDLEKTIQDLEAANEELKSSNEELLSMNEELQSANEEMETSKEEIQSANEALTRSNNDLENLLASTRIATLFLDEQQRIVRFTPAMTAVFNLIPSDVGRPLADITHRAVSMPPLGRRAAGETAATTKGESESESEIQTVEGHWYIRRVLPYRTHLGQEQGMVVTFTDVTALKAAQQALQESEHHFRQLAEAMPQLVWTTRADGSADYFNRRWYEYTGTPPEQALGGSWTQAVHPEDHEATLGAWNEAVASGSRYEAESRLRGANGAYQWFLGRGLPVRDAESRVTRWFGTCTNIHSQKQAEEALKDADHQKNLFLAMLAHELRNPLAALKGHAQLLQEQLAAGSRQHDKARRVVSEAERLEALSEDLLSFVRTTVIERQTISPADLLRECALSVDESHIDVVTDQAPPRFQLDPARMHQVLCNLLRNAVEASPPAGRVLAGVRTEGNELLFYVRDFGKGIQTQDIEKIFEPFYTTRARGTGLGLPIARRLVVLHGGTLTASNAPEGGALFCVRLPVSGRSAA